MSNLCFDGNMSKKAVFLFTFMLLFLTLFSAVSFESASQINAEGWTVDFKHEPWAPQVGENVTFQAFVTPSEINITVFVWNFGDGTVQVAETKVASHVYVARGIYKVTLKVVADDGETRTVSKILSVITSDELWWFDYETMSVCWRANVAKGSFFVDFDEDRSTAALTNWGYWHVDYGVCCSLGVAKIISEHNVGYGWAFIIGEQEIDPPGYAHIHKTEAGDITEWFYYWVPKIEPPTDWVVCLQQSNGTVSMPVNETFWWSRDAEVWFAYTPVEIEAVATVDIEPDALNLRTAHGWLTVFVEFPAGDYSVSDIDVSTIVIDNMIPADPTSATIGDYDNDSIPDLMVQFNVSTVSEHVLPRLFALTYLFGNATVTLTGKLQNGTVFAGVGTFLYSGLVGDINVDGKVDIRDVAKAALAFGSTPSMPNWNPRADLNGDEKVNIRDIAWICMHFGQQVV